MKININEKDINMMINECCHRILKEWDDDEARMENYYNSNYEMEEDMPDCKEVFYRRSDGLVTADDSICANDCEENECQWFIIYPEILDYDYDSDEKGSYFDITELGVGKYESMCDDIKLSKYELNHITDEMNQMIDDIVNY